MRAVIELFRHGLDQNVQQIVGPQAHLATRQANDTGIARPEHFDFRSAAQPQFLQTMNVVGVSDNATNMGRPSRGQILQRNHPP
jgi:hypothetical protein